MKIRGWLARHAQTLLGSLGRIVKQPAGALLTMAVIAMALALPLLLEVILDNTRSATSTWNQSLDISAYLDKKAAQGRAPALAKQLLERSDVAAVRVISAEDALTEFRKESGFGAALDELKDNPLPATLLVTPTFTAGSPDQLAALEQFIASAPDVQTVQMDTAWVKRLYAILDIFRRLAWLSAGLLGLGVVLIVGNTVRLDILNRRGEIEVMKLVGATDGFARRPFLYSGVWYGLGGGLMALGTVAIAIRLLAGPVSRLTSLYPGAFHLKGPGPAVGLTMLGCGMALGWLGSWVAATRHIRAIEPT